ncbi:MAG: serine O-acetyltransferase [Gammaproteobacteria bacterium]|nr:serine O-acetyltransferase [Gammaproteobacteria bacterium]
MTQTTTASIWPVLVEQAKELAAREPLLASYYHSRIIEHDSFADALACQVAAKLDTPTVAALVLDEVFSEILRERPDIAQAAVDDLLACYERDPACDYYCMPFLHFKGYLAIQAHRFAHFLWQSNRRSMARYIQHMTSVLYQVDVHPAAQLGSGIMFDHATGVVIGETAVVGNNVSLLHGVTLGGSGNLSGKRHPTIGDGVMISCGVKILGDITVGDGVRIGGGSLVLESVPAHVTIVGVPAKIIGRPADEAPALSMQQDITR